MIERVASRVGRTRKREVSWGRLAFSRDSPQPTDAYRYYALRLLPRSSILATSALSCIFRLSGFCALLLAAYAVLHSTRHSQSQSQSHPTPSVIPELPASMALKSVIFPASGKHTATLIFSHGLGDTGHGWSFLAEQLAHAFPYVKFMFPNAPSIPITLNGGYKMPGWFDVK